MFREIIVCARSGVFRVIDYWVNSFSNQKGLVYRFLLNFQRKSWKISSNPRKNDLKICNLIEIKLQIDLNNFTISQDDSG